MLGANALLSVPTTIRDEGHDPQIHNLRVVWTQWGSTGIRVHVRDEQIAVTSDVDAVAMRFPAPALEDDVALPSVVMPRPTRGFTRQLR